MNKTNIEWTDFTWNPVTGCTKRCNYCYAHRLAQGRLHKLYLANSEVAPGCDPDDPFSPRFWQGRLDEPCTKRKPSKIFTGSMAEFFDPRVPEEWIKAVLAVASFHERHTFQFLTKQPGIAARHTFPPNAWVGVTIEDGSNECEERRRVMQSVNAPIRFVSYEPLTGRPMSFPSWADWVIIGAMTGPHAFQPKPEWVNSLINIADAMDVPVFLKDNLNWPEPRQEWPRGV